MNDLLSQYAQNDLLSQYAPSFLAAVAGGILSLIGSLGATLMAMRSAKKVNQETEKQDEANSAISAYLTLFDYYSFLGNLDRHIGNCFKEAHENENSELEPWAKVRILIGMELELPKIQTGEISFLIKTGKLDLFSKIKLIQKRTEAINASAIEYNTLRRKINEFAEINLSEVKFVDGNLASADFDKKPAQVLAMRIHEIQSLLGQLMERIEVDKSELMETIVEFQDEARNYFGNKFYNLNIEEE